MASIQVQNKESQSQSDEAAKVEIEIEIEIEIVVDHENDDLSSSSSSFSRTSNGISMIIKALFLPVLEKVHAGYFRISLGLCSQALLWKILISEPCNDIHPFRRILQMLPFTAFILIWSLALFILVSLSLLYLLHCFLYYDVVKTEFFHHVGVNYLFAPWISWLLLLQSTPFFKPGTTYYLVLWWVFILPILALDFKIYGEWFTKGKRVLSGRMGNPTTQLSAIGNLVGAGAAAQMGWIETAICMFSLGMVHYFVMFVTLYQRLPGSSNLPAMLRPVFFSFIAAPSIASLAWNSIAGNFDTSSKMLFFLSLFMFISLVRYLYIYSSSLFNTNFANKIYVLINFC